MYVCTLLRKKHLTDPDTLTGKVGLPIYIDTEVHTQVVLLEQHIVQQLHTNNSGNAGKTVGRSFVQYNKTVNSLPNIITYLLQEMDRLQLRATAQVQVDPSSQENFQIV